MTSVTMPISYRKVSILMSSGLGDVSPSAAATRLLASCAGVLADERDGLLGEGLE
ncbi:MAG: hypothetical protein U0235_30370 [Polyangiaceae bacterium]